MTEPDHAGHAGPPDPPTRLARRLDVGDAVVVGLGAMVGAGVFAVLAPAAAAAGTGLLAGLALAAAVAWCNADSSARLAARHPASGGTYVYGRERLGHAWGFLAGWGFVVGKTASCAAMALTFGAYVDDDLARPLAVGAVVALATVDLLGVRKTAVATRALVAAVLAVLAVVVVASLPAAGSAGTSWQLVGPGGPAGVLQAAGLLFFAFAGYARIATLGEEVRDPARTIPRAIPIALGIALATYAAVAVTALAVAGPDALAASPAPLADVVRLAGATWAVPVVAVGAALASLGVLLSLLVGVGRTTFAMAAEGDLPRALGVVHPGRRVPQRATVAVALAVVAVVLVADVRGAIGFSSFAVLAYYAVANASAWTLPGRRARRLVPAVGLAGCVVLACSLPAASVVAGAAVLALGAAAWLARTRLPR